MISCTTVEKSIIQRHYDVSTIFYRLLWGPHIHHGLWHADESIAQAQLQLTDTLASLACIRRGDVVLDIGCGMGGSSIHLAKRYDCSVTGITISKLQRHWGTASAWLQHLGQRVRIRQADAESFGVAPESLDVAWSIECTEHLFQKPKFFRRAATWLRPGGRMAICAWLAGDTDGSPVAEKLVHDVCEGFFCPSLGTMRDYQSWFEDAGLELTVCNDWTKNVMQTWEICRRRVNQSGVRWIAPWIDRKAMLFLDRFEAILEAYRSGAMQYGCFVAEKKNK